MQKFPHIVHVMMSDKDNVFIFKFESKVMGGRTEKTSVTEISKNYYRFDCQALNLEDIVLDMRDRITNELLKVEKNGSINVQGRQKAFKFSENFIKEVDGNMEFFVRKVNQMQRSSIGGGNQEFHWRWDPLNDFDRMEKFADDEVFDGEVVFRLINTSGEDVNDIEEYMDEVPKHIRDGYNCYSLYKHQDDSYEWKLCKLIKQELRPEFRGTQLAKDAFMDIGKASMKNYKGEGQGSTNTIQDQDKYYYHLEFEHLKEYGKEMWVKRRREDLIFSSQYARDQINFDKQCRKFILDSYKSR